MRKFIFHNTKSIEQDLEIKLPVREHLKKRKRNVDINTLLNRVKIKEQDDLKKKLIFCGFGILLLSCMGTFISIIK
tara:strand:+ start:856 stop:1083 length:228 start_codon:yes stop_codon:yes gene_type:complete